MCCSLTSGFGMEIPQIWSMGRESVRNSGTPRCNGMRPGFCCFLVNRAKSKVTKQSQEGRESKTGWARKKVMYVSGDSALPIGTDCLSLGALRVAQFLCRSRCWLRVVSPFFGLFFRSFEGCLVWRSTGRRGASTAMNPDNCDDVDRQMVPGFEALLL